MTSLNIKEIIEKSKKNFERIWIDSARLIPKGTQVERKEKGKSHPVRDMIQKSREMLLDLGFTEIENKTILTDADVYKEYGPEAPVILDRAFYLSKLPRPDVGLSKERTVQIEKMMGKFNPGTLQEILRSYKKGEIEGDNFVEELVKRLKIKTEQATEVLDKVFAEFRKSKPQPTNQTLRSHMSGTWYHTLTALQNKSNYPLALFSVGPRYRNEQREDKGHLRVHHSASIVVMDPNMSLEAGRSIVKEILEKYGFEDVKFETKKATAKYYAKDQEQEVFAKHRGKWFEIADIGMYSVISLANFGIKYPVFNAGFGVERLVMVLQDYDDIRKLVYPQFGTCEYSDEEIARSITYIHKPQTENGKTITEAIEKTARKYKDEIAPCEFTAYEDDQLLIKIVEREEGKRLIGPAGFNEIYVKDGNIYSNPKPQETSTGINYMKSIAYGIASKIEKDTLADKKYSIYKIKMTRSLPDINLKISESLRDDLTGNHRKIVVGGPIFITVEYLKKNNREQKSL